MNSRAVHLHIDRILVEGLPASEQRRFAHSLEKRLTEMAESGVAGGLAGGTRRRIAGLNAGPLRTGATADQAAEQVVAAIQHSLAGGGGTHHHV